MSEDDFLSRWSRRKRAAEEEAAKPPEPVAAVAPPAVPVPDEPVVDLEKLPPLDSITSLTDVTAFLQKGVPLDLTRAALRRAWSADPSIRDFVGLAENAWDFTDPNAMPGFGPLDYSADQVKALVSEIFGDTKKAAEKLAELTGEPENSSNPAEIAAEAMQPDSTEPEQDTDRIKLTATQIADGRSATNHVATHHETEDAFVAVPRSHGGALPQ